MNENTSDNKEKVIFDENKVNCGHDDILLPYYIVDSVDLITIFVWLLRYVIGMFILLNGGFFMYKIIIAITSSNNRIQLCT